jgi:hypothetical protein
MTIVPAQVTCSTGRLLPRARGAARQKTWPTPPRSAASGADRFAIVALAVAAARTDFRPDLRHVHLRLLSGPTEGRGGRGRQSGAWRVQCSGV